MSPVGRTPLAESEAEEQQGSHPMECFLGSSERGGGATSLLELKRCQTEGQEVEAGLPEGEARGGPSLHSRAEGVDQSTL